MNDPKCIYCHERADRCKCAPSEFTRGHDYQPKHATLTNVTCILDNSLPRNTIKASSDTFRMLQGIQPADETEGIDGVAKKLDEMQKEHDRRWKGK